MQKDCVDGEPLLVVYTTSVDKDIRKKVGKMARECMAMRTRRLDRIVTRLYDDALRPFGIKSTQLSLLVGIAVSGSIQPVELGRRLVMEKSTVSRNVARLIERGWVDTVMAQGGRGQSLAVTRSGEALLNKAHAAWKIAQRDARVTIGADISDALSDMSKAS